MMARAIRGCIHVATAVCVVALVAACSDGTPRIYRAGQYQGAPVVAPQDSPTFGGNRQSWESRINARVAQQNEYTRMRGD